MGFSFICLGCVDKINKYYKGAYVDDTYCVITGKHDNIIFKIQKYLADIQEYFDGNLLKINTDKTQVVIWQEQYNKQCGCPAHFNIKKGNNKLKYNKDCQNATEIEYKEFYYKDQKIVPQEMMKILGLTIQRNLTFNDYVYKQW